MGTLRTGALGLIASAVLIACGSDDPATTPQAAGGNSGNAGFGGIAGIGGGAGSSGSGGTVSIDIDGGGVGDGRAGTGGQGPYVLPDGFTKTDLGGYKLGDPFNAGAPPPTPGNACGTTIAGVVRDFKGANEAGGHPDFEAFEGKGPTVGMVPVDLLANSKPGYTGICETTQTGPCKYQQQTTSAANFDQWYNYAPDVNKPYVLYLSLEPNGDVFTFQSDFFFPLDNAGWGNFGKAQDKKEHNFNFTTEIHTEFKYNGGEKFTFIGDDDVWVFINKRLAVDLGGLHPQETGSILLDESAATLGISSGNTYALDLFHAERHTNASHFRVDTNLQFTNCGTFVPDIPR